MQQNPIWIEPTRWAMRTKVLACRPLRQPCTNTKEVDTNIYCSPSCHFVTKAVASPRRLYLHSSASSQSVMTTIPVVKSARRTKLQRAHTNVV